MDLDHWPLLNQPAGQVSQFRSHILLDHGAHATRIRSLLILHAENRHVMTFEFDSSVLPGSRARVRCRPAPLGRAYARSSPEPGRDGEGRGCRWATSRKGLDAISRVNVWRRLDPPADPGECEAIHQWAHSKHDAKPVTTLAGTAKRWLSGQPSSDLRRARSSGATSEE